MPFSELKTCLQVHLYIFHQWWERKFNISCVHAAYHKKPLSEYHKSANC